MSIYNKWATAVCVILEKVSILCPSSNCLFIFLAQEIQFPTRKLVVKYCLLCVNFPADVQVKIMKLHNTICTSAGITVLLSWEANLLWGQPLLWGHDMMHYMIDFSRNWPSYDAQSQSILWGHQLSAKGMAFREKEHCTSCPVLFKESFKLATDLPVNGYEIMKP